MTDDTRGSGSTTRQLEKLVDQARQGKSFVYITMGPAGYYIDLAYKIGIVMGAGIRFDYARQLVTVNTGHSTTKIHFFRGDCGLGWVEQCMRLRPIEVVFDHAVPLPVQHAWAP